MYVVCIFIAVLPLCLRADKRALNVSGCTGDYLEEGLNGRDREESGVPPTERVVMLTERKLKHRQNRISGMESRHLRRSLRPPKS